VVIGKPFGEAEMLRVAFAYEEAAGWEGRRAEV
jgi:Asp-tRNA(Asn)/Glu-tRNA(Gln) amidotransferase A subunit family amidase